MRAILHVLSRCDDPERLAEFHDWYENVHIPDVMELPEFLRATRYELSWSAQDDGPQFLAVWEVETDDISGAREKLLAHVRAKAEAGRVTMHDTFVGAGLSWYRCISDTEGP